MRQVAARSLGQGHVATAICVAHLGTFDRSLNPARGQGPCGRGAATGEGPVSMGGPRDAAGALGSTASPGPCPDMLDPTDAQHSAHAAQRSGQGGAAQGCGGRLLECVVVASHRLPEAAGAPGEGFLTVLQLRAGPLGGAAELAALDTLQPGFSCTSLAAMPDAPNQAAGERGVPRRYTGATRMWASSISEAPQPGWALPARAGAHALLLGSADGAVHLVRLAVDGAHAARPGEGSGPKPYSSTLGGWPVGTGVPPSSGAEPAARSGSYSLNLKSNINSNPLQLGLEGGGDVAGASRSRSPPDRERAAGLACASSSQPQPGHSGGPAPCGPPAGPAAGIPEGFWESISFRHRSQEDQAMAWQGVASMDRVAAMVAPWVPPPEAAAAAGADARSAPEQQASTAALQHRAAGVARALRCFCLGLREATRGFQDHVVSEDIEALCDEHLSREAIAASIEFCAREDRPCRVVREDCLATARLPGRGCVTALDAQVPHTLALDILVEFRLHFPLPHPTLPGMWWGGVHYRVCVCKGMGGRDFAVGRWRASS